MLAIVWDQFRSGGASAEESTACTARTIYVSRSPTSFGCSCHLSLFESQTSRRHILTNHIIKRWLENKPLWLFREQQQQKRVGTANVWQNASSSNYVQLLFFFLRKTTFSYLDGLSFVTSSFVSTRFDLWYCWFWQDKHRHWYQFTSYMQHAVREGDGRCMGWSETCLWCSSKQY